MAIIKWSPFGEIDRFFDESFFPGAFDKIVPAIDVYQTEKEVIVESSIPGIDPEKIDISIEGDILTLKGKTEDKQEIKRENYYRKEISKGEFQRSVVLPVSVKGEETKAEFKNGMLKVVISKEEKAMPKRIAVKITK